jgi:IPT/TIG domain
LHFFGKPGAGLPNLPDTLLALSGVSAATYVGKKGLSDEAGPTVRSIVPPKAAVGQSIRILGVNLATVRDRSVTVTIGGVETPAPQVTIKDAVTEVATTVPAGAPQGQTELVVVAFDGRSTGAQSFEVL